MSSCDGHAWLIDNLVELATGSFMAVNFLGDEEVVGCTQAWQSAVDMIYRCSIAGLLRLNTSSDLSHLSLEGIIIRLSSVNPCDYSSMDWGDIGVWIGTQLEGTVMCSELVARFGLLNVSEALILADGWELAANDDDHIFPSNGLATREDALFFSRKMRDCADRSLSAAVNLGGECQKSPLCTEVVRMFEDAGVWSDGRTLFPVATK